MVEFSYPSVFLFDSLTAKTGSSLSLVGSIADGATAVANKAGNVNSLTASGAKIFVFYSDNLATEKASVSKDGDFISASGKFGLDSTDYIQFFNNLRVTFLINNSTSFQVKSTTVEFNRADSLATNTPMSFWSYENDDASATCFIFNSANTMTNAGSKLFLLTNNTAEKLYVKKDGDLYVETNKRVACGGGSTTADTTVNGSVTLEINGTSYKLATIT